MDEMQLIVEAVVGEARSHALADGRTLYTALIESHNETYGTFDGFLVSDFERYIKAVLARTPIQQKIAAFNQLALQEGFDTVGPDEFDLDLWIWESFIDPSLNELIRQHKCQTRRKYTPRGQK